jgi:hypothetical protein
MYIPSRGCGRHKYTKKDCGDCRHFSAERQSKKAVKVPRPRKEKIVLAKMFPKIFAAESANV